MEFTLTEKKQFPWLAVVIGVGCVGVLCVGVLVVGGGAAFFLTQRTASSSGPEAVVTVEVKVATIMPEPTDIPPIEPTTAIEPTAPGTSLTGDQYVDESSLYDDFSSDALGWPVYDDGTTILKYEDDSYSFQIAEPEYIDWAYFPVDFVPYEIWFDVQGRPGPQDGTFGVFCQYQDVDNHYYVELDLETNSYIIAQYLDGEDIPLTKQNTAGQFWYESDAFKSSPDDINHIGIGCYLEEITLFINDQLVDQVKAEQPFDQPGEAAFFVYSFSFAGPEGYKVFFDNVEVWQPVQ
jgi:hypothetical protein